MADPADASSWEWSTGVDESPRLSIDEIKDMTVGAADPFKLVENDISTLSGGIKELLGSDHPVLESCAK